MAAIRVGGAELRDARRGALHRSPASRRRVAEGWATRRAALARRPRPRYGCGVATVFRPVARLIALVLLLQVVLAPAHCLAMVANPAGFETVICSPDGMRTMHLGPDGQAVPAPEAQASFCPACHALPEAFLPPAPILATPAWLAVAIVWQPAPAHALPQAARAPPFSPRAPPAFA